MMCGQVTFPAFCPHLISPFLNRIHTPIGQNPLNTKNSLNEGKIMTTKLDLIRILKTETDKLTIDIEDLFYRIDKIKQFLDLMYDITLKDQFHNEQQQHIQKRQKGSI